MHNLSLINRHTRFARYNNNCSIVWYHILLLQVENGIVRNWDDMEHLWNYTFYEKMKVRVHC